MASNLPYVILWNEAVARFEREEIPWIREQYEQDGEIDYVARCTVWNDWTDMLCKNNEISDWQYENWDHPDCCLTEEEIRERDNQ